MDFNAALDWLTDASLVFAFLIAPALYLWAIRYHRSYRGVIYSWKIPGTATLTIVAFALNLSLFILTAIFFSGILGSRTYPEIFTFSADSMRRFAMISGFLLIGFTLIYMGLVRTLTHLITRDGICLIRFRGLFFLPVRQRLAWSDMQDYFFREDYPVREYTFLLNAPNGGRNKVSFKVPYTACADFEQILSHFLDLEMPDEDEPFKIWKTTDSKGI
jgi:hypothetical protein